MVVIRGEVGPVESALGKAGQIYGNGKKLKFGCGTHSRVHGCHIIMYTGNLCNVINNCYCNKYNFKNSDFFRQAKIYITKLTCFLFIISPFQLCSTFLKILT